MYPGAGGWPTAASAGIGFERGVMDGDTEYGEGFDLRQARLRDFCPTDDVLAEMGRVAIAAARVDSQLALLLLAVKYPEPENLESLDVLRRWSTGRLAEQAQRVLKRRFEGHLPGAALAAVNCAAERQDQRHVVLRSRWTPEPPDTLVKVGILAGLGSQDELVQVRGQGARYTTLHPRGGGPGPQGIAEMDQIRAHLEDSKNTLEQLRFVLASALFSGSLAGAMEVLPLTYPDLRTGPGRSGWKGLDELP